MGAERQGTARRFGSTMAGLLEAPPRTTRNDAIELLRGALALWVLFATFCPGRCARDRMDRFWRR